MKKVAVNKPSIKLVGLTTRTKNADEFNPATAKIGPLIGDYFSHGVAQLIANRTNPGITIAAYTDYESDHTGEYTYFIGEEVSSFENIPDGLHFMTIPESEYQRFTTPAGQMPAIVIQAWEKIWQMTPETLSAKRAYIADFEIYDERSMDPNNAVVDIYIGVK